MVNSGSVDQEFTVNNNNVISRTDENTMNVQTLERSVARRIVRDLGNIVNTVKDRSQSAILTVIDNIVTARIELTFSSIKMSYGRDTTSVKANLERGEHMGINICFQNESKMNSTFLELNANDSTRENIFDEASELSVPTF